MRVRGDANSFGPRERWRSDVSECRVSDAASNEVHQKMNAVYMLPSANA